MNLLNMVSVAQITFSTEISEKLSSLSQSSSSFDTEVCKFVITIHDSIEFVIFIYKCKM